MVRSAAVIRTASSHATYAPSMHYSIALTSSLYGIIHRVGLTAIVPTIGFGSRSNAFQEEEEEALFVTAPSTGTSPHQDVYVLQQQRCVSPQGHTPFSMLLVGGLRVPWDPGIDRRPFVPRTFVYRERVWYALCCWCGQHSTSRMQDDSITMHSHSWLVQS